MHSRWDSQCHVRFMSVCVYSVHKIRRVDRWNANTWEENPCARTRRAARAQDLWERYRKQSQLCKQWQWLLAISRHLKTNGSAFSSAKPERYDEECLFNVQWADGIRYVLETMFICPYHAFKHYIWESLNQS